MNNMSHWAVEALTQLQAFMEKVWASENAGTASYWQAVINFLHYIAEASELSSEDIHTIRMEITDMQYWYCEFYVLDPHVREKANELRLERRMTAGSRKLSNWKLSLLDAESASRSSSRIPDHNEKGPSSSSRLKEKRGSNEDRDDLQPHPTQTRGGDTRTFGGQRKRDQGDDLQPPARLQQSIKKRRTDTNTVRPASDHKRKRDQEEDYDQHPQITSIPTDPDSDHEEYVSARSSPLPPTPTSIPTTAAAASSSTTVLTYPVLTYPVLSTKRTRNNGAGRAAAASRRHKEGTFKSSSRIRKGYQDTRSPRRSSRVRQQAGSKRGRGDAAAAAATPAAAAPTTTKTTGHKRKRGQEEEDVDLLQPRTTSTKKRRTDTTNMKPPAAGTVLGSKTERGLDDLVQDPQNQGEPRGKRRRIDPNTNPPRSAGKRTANHGPEEHPLLERKRARAASRPVSPRVTRAQRQRSSG